MKYNLNQYIMDSSKFTHYYLESQKIDFIDYHKHVQQYESYWQELHPRLFDLCNQYNINILPYLYVFRDEYNINSFKKFFMVYLKKADMMEENSESSIFDIASLTPEHLAAFVFTIQYYFL